MTNARASQATEAPVFHEPFCSAASRPYLLAAAVLASALGIIDGTIVAIALPAMRDSLGAALVEAQWIHNAYMLTLSALILAGGGLGDRYGHARIFASGIALFVAASLCCALAPSALWLIFFRAVQGTGAALMIPGSLALIARAYPKEARGRAIGIWAASTALTTPLGPVLGGIMLTLGGPEAWRWVFAINLPLGALALLMLAGRVRQDSARTITPVDIAGATLATFTLFALAWGLTTWNHSTPWATVWLIAGALSCAAFLRVEARSPHPMMPLSLFSARTFSAANLMTFLLYSALSMMVFFMPMTFISGWGLSEIETSAIFAPVSVCIALFSARASRLADRTGAAPLLTAGALAVACGYGALALLAPAQNFWAHMVPAMCLVGLGMSAIVAPLSTAVMGAVPETATGIASGVNNAVTRMAGLISVAAVGGLMAALYSAAGGTAQFGEASQVPGHAAAMTTAFQGLAVLAAALAMLSAALGWLVRPTAATR